MTSSDLKTDQIFSSNMILPFAKSFTISGQAKPNTLIKVMIGDQIQTTITNPVRRWRVKFNPINNYHSRYKIQIEGGNDQLVLENVRFGRIVLVAGQSNMGFRMIQDRDYESEKEQFNLTNVSYYNVPQPTFVYQNGQVTEYTSKKTHWHELRKDNLGHVSAIAFYMAQSMAKKNQDLPIGIVCCTKDGAMISTWIDENSLRQDPEFNQKIILPFKTQIENISDADFKSDIARYKELVHQHNRRMYNFIKNNPTIPLGEALNIVGETPWPPPTTPDSYLKPGALFNSMVKKMVPYHFDEVIWYQGETDKVDGDIYDRLLEQMIMDWRKRLEEDDLPFYIVQLPKYIKTVRNAWAKIRQQQLKVCRKVPGTHLISIVDTGEMYNPHPTTKRKIGYRIGDMLVNCYGQSTPVLKRVIHQDDQTIFEFDYVKRLQISQPGFIEGYVNHQWEAFEIKIQGASVMVHFPMGVSAARYGYSNAPILTLFDEKQRPIAPFLIDLKQNRLL